MNQVMQLVDIPLPEPISWWPLSTGWYVVLIAICLALGLLMIRKRRRWVANRYRRVAYRELQTLTLENASAMNQILRQAVSNGKSSIVLNHTGVAWYQLIRSSSKQPILSESQLFQLEQLNYQPAQNVAKHLSQNDFVTLKELCLRWVKEHHFEHES